MFLGGIIEDDAFLTGMSSYWTIMFLWGDIISDMIPVNQNYLKSYEE